MSSSSEHHDVAAAPRRHDIVETFEQDAPIGQASQRIFGGELVQRRRAAPQRAGQPSGHAEHGRRGQRQHQSEQSRRCPTATSWRGQRVVRRPAEPADDAALSVVQRLHFAPGTGQEVTVKSEVVEPGPPCDLAKPGLVKVAGIGGRGPKLAERAFKRVVACRHPPRVIVPLRDQAGGSASR